MMGTESLVYFDNGWLHLLDPYAPSELRDSSNELIQSNSQKDFAQLICFSVLRG